MNEHDPFQLSVFGTKRTGLPFPIWLELSVPGYAGAPRAWIRCAEQWCPATIDAPLDWLGGNPPSLHPSHENALVTFLRLNIVILRAHWNGTLDSAELAEALHPITCPEIVRMYTPGTSPPV